MTQGSGVQETSTVINAMSLMCGRYVKNSIRPVAGELEWSNNNPDPPGFTVNFC